MSTAQTTIGPASVKVLDSWYSEQDTRWTTGYFVYNPGTGNRCFSFPVPSERLWNFTGLQLTKYTRSEALAVRAIPHIIHVLWLKVNIVILMILLE